MIRIFILWLLGLAMTATLRAESRDERSLTVLREQGLYQAAEQLGTQQWQREDLSDRDRATLAIQLALVYTEHALASPPHQRAELWTKAEQVCAAFRERWPENPRRLLVDVQSALVTLARGEQLRDEASVTATPMREASQMLPALEQLRTASRRLQQLADEVNQELIERRMRPSIRRPEDALTEDELQSLARHVSLHLARALGQQAICHPPRSADRDDALLQAIEQLEPLAQQTQLDELAWDARVETAKFLRQLGRVPGAADRLAAWSRDRPPPHVAARLAAEQVRVLLAAGRVDTARQLADRTIASMAGHGDADDHTNAELAMARLEVALSAWQHAPRPERQPTDRPADARELTQQAAAIRDRFGPNWGRRAELLVGRAMAASTSGGSTDSLLLAAEHLYHTGRTQEAIAAYERAARMLEQNRQPDEAFSATMTAAAIERGARQYADAAARYRRLALAQPNHPRAAEAHHLAILSTADVLRTAAPADRQQFAAEYEQLLVEYLAHWPADRPADDVRWWLGRLQAGRHDWLATVRTLEQVSPTSERFEDAVRLVVEGYDDLLGTPAQTGRPTRAEALAAATHFLQPIITGPDNRWPVEWTPMQRSAALALARLHLQHDGHVSYAQRLLTAAVAGHADAPLDRPDQAWETQARSLLVLSRTRSGTPVDEDEFAATVSTYAELARQHPDDGAIQENYAELLAKSRAEEVLRAALNQWLRVEQRSRRGGSRWRRARTARIELLARLGNRDDAEKLASLTRLLYPDWDTNAR